MRYWDLNPPRRATADPPKRGAPTPNKPRPGPQSSAPKTDPRISSRNTTPPPENRNRRKIEMIDYPEDAALVDHKGRTKPIYKPQTPRPQAWRPSHGMRLLMGLVPGVRLLALQSLALGLVYVVPGLVTLLLGIFMVLYWSASSERLALLQGEPRWLLVQAAGILGAALVYELLRAAAALEERVKAPKGPRILGALVIPGFVAVIGAPHLVFLDPPLVEATFFAGLILAMGGTPGALWCTLENGARPEIQHQRFKVGMIILGLACILLVGLLLGGGALFPRWIKIAQDHGFHLLPNLLQ